METINHETYVSLEVAKLLKDAGFDWKCKYAYIITPAGDMPTGEEGMLTEYVENVNWLVSAPTLEVAQRWLREVKGLDIIVSRFFPIHEMKYSYEYEYTVIASDGVVEAADCYFEEYEEALEAGIKKCLTLILQEDGK